MKTLLLILFACCCTINLSAQSCPLNIDFEEGNFTNWQCSIGSTYSSNGKNFIKLKNSPPTTGRHEIIAADSNGVIPLDEFGRFPKLCPYGGKYSVKLGNTDVNAEAEGISYTFTVPPQEDTFSFTYFYAVVFENPGHNPEDQPRFFVSAYETATGNLINCASYNYVSTGSIPGFKESKTGSDVLYKEWSPVSIQFINLENKQVTLEFKTGDCTQGGHFGYAYLDVGSGCSNILATAPYCRETNSLLLNAPYGFQNYTWYNEDYSKIIGHDQNITLSPPPITAGKFWVDLIPYPGYGCRDTAYALVTPLPVPDTPIAPTNYFFCQNINAPALHGSPSKNCDLVWYTDTTQPGSFEAIVPSTAKPGITNYYVSQKILFGCESFRKKVAVKVDPVPVTSFNINTTTACQKDNFFTCKSASTNLKEPTYIWDFGNKDTLVGKDSVSYKYPGYGAFTLTLRVQNGPVCYNKDFKNITVVPKPLAAFDYPAILCQNQTQVAINDQSTVPQQLSQITNWKWTINGAESYAQNPSAFIAAVPGDLPVSLNVITKEGCVSDTLKKILKIHFQPTAMFSFDNNNLCDNKAIHFLDQSSLPSAAAGENINTWQWMMDATPVKTQNVNYLYAAGNHNTTLTVQTNFGCNSLPVQFPAVVYPKPTIAININDSCVYRKIIYRAQDISHSVDKWYWNFGSGLNEDKPLLTKYFLYDGDNSFTIIGKTINSCTDTINRHFLMYMNRAFAGRDTVGAVDQPMQLNANGGTDNHYTWSPAVGLNDAKIEAPVATYYKDQLYRLDAITNEGCDAHSRIMIKRFNGPDIYIPTAFTPNNDKLNDIFKAFPVGMKSLNYFAVYNRYGQQIFYTKDFSQGWNGYVKGIQAKPETYVAVAQATDYTGKAFLKKVTVVLIR